MALAQVNMVAFKTIIVIGLKRVLRMWKMVLLPPVLTSILYFIIFGTVMGQRIGLMQGVPYMSYIVPGLVMMSVIMVSYAQTSFSLFLDKFQHSIEDMLVAPIFNIVLLLGYVFVGIFRGLLVGILVVLVTMFFTHIQFVHCFDTFVSILLASALFSSAGLLNAIFARNFDDISVVPTFFLVPLIYLGGVFYPISALPIGWRELSYLNPIAYIISSLRYSMLGLGGAHWWTSLLLMFLLAMTFLLVANYLLGHSSKIRT